MFGRYGVVSFCLAELAPPFSPAASAGVRPRRKRVGVPGGSGLSHHCERYPKHGARLREDSSGTTGGGIKG